MNHDPQVITIGIDPGKNTGLAAVRNGECIYAGSIHGGTWPRWLASARAVLDEVSTPRAIYIEEPEPVIRRAAGMAHHRSGFGLGLRAGALLTLCDERMLSPIFVPTSEWWAAWGTLHHFAGKSKSGMERVREAIHLVPGAGAWLEDVPPTRKVDVAEAILIAGGMGRRAGVGP